MFKKSLLAAAALTMVAGASQAQLLNGTFSGSTIEPNFFTQSGVGSVNGGWTVVGTAGQGVVFYGPPLTTNINGANVPFFDSPNDATSPGVWVDLTGLQPTLGNGISQTFNLAPGQYNLSFDIGVIPFFNHPATVQVTGPGFSSNFTNSDTGGDPLLQDWNTYTTTFVAGSGPTTLTFIAAPNSSPFPNQFNSIGLDNIQISQVTAVPEPSAYAMMIAGLGVLGFAARRKRKSA